MLEFRRFFGVSQRWVPRRVPYADDGEHEVLAIVSENTVNNVREFS